MNNNIDNYEEERHFPGLKRIIIIVVCVAALAFLAYCNITA